jgi:hypothetical protein
MANRWTYGNYQFAINPNSHEMNYEVVGDNVRTLSGAFISQPTSVVETYSISSVFYQTRNRMISEVSIPNGLKVKYYNNSFYVLNKVNDRIDIYNSNFTLTTSLSLSALSVKTYVGFEVQTDGTIWVCSDAPVNDTYYKLSNAGALLQTTPLVRTIPSTVGIAVTLGYMWVLKSEGTLEKVRLTDFAKIATYKLPTGVNYSGLAADGSYLMASNNDNGLRTIYMIDCDNGNTVSSIVMSELTNLSEVTKSATTFYTFNATTSKMQVIKGNTVQLDIYKLEKEILNNRFVTMIDDMGVSYRVYVTDMKKSRRMGYETMYDVSLQIQKVNRG